MTFPGGLSMKLPQIGKIQNWNYVALAFAVPMGLFLILMFITSVTPFGGYTFLYSDNYHQYYPFFRQFRQALRSGDSLLWTWSVGMGLDYLGLISYYLASPLNLLSVLLPESWTLTYFTLLMPIKLSLASCFFAIMLKKLFRTNDLSLTLFGSLYGLCAWALGYQWNIMWLDTFALLPLVALGTVLLLRDKSYILYTISLFFSLFANYYVGFFVCIFVFLLFFCYEICRWQGLKRFLLDFVRIGIFTVLAIGMTAILELPTLAALQDTYSSVNKFPTNFELNIASSELQEKAKSAWNAYQNAKKADTATFKLWADAMVASFPPLIAAMAQVAGNIPGGHTPTYMEGLPNLYCGIFPIILGFLFFLSREIKLRDKLCCAFLLIFFQLSMVIRQLDYIWHGFHFTNQIPYRFSFLFSFVLLYMAYRAWMVRSSFVLLDHLAAGLMGLAILFLGMDHLSDPLYWLFNLTFLAIYALALVYPKLKDRPETPADLEEAGEVPQEAGEVPKKRRISLPDSPTRQKQAAVLLTVAIMVELSLHLALFVSGFSIYDYDYPKKEEDAASMFAVIRELEADSDQFCRMEVTHAQTLNDGALNGYNGITTFTSSANVATTKFMQALGAAAYPSWNRYCYEESSPVSNLFLNLKYLVERDNPTEGNAYFDVKHIYKGLTLLENNAYLPLGFLAESTLANSDFPTDSGSFTFQNTLFRDATGCSGNVWRSLSNSQVTIAATDDVTIKNTPYSGYCSFSTGSGGQLIYTFKPDRPGFLCLDMNLYKQDDFSVWKNGQRLYSESYSLEQMVAVGDVTAEDTIELRISCNANMDSTSVSVKAAVLDEGLFRQGYEVLAASQLRLIQFSATRIAGNITCDRDGLLYTSVPQDGNWVVYVDGEPAAHTLVGNCMVSVPLTEGWHQVELRYENQAFRLGCLITMSCAAIFGAIVWLDYRKKKEA